MIILDESTNTVKEENALNFRQRGGTYQPSFASTVKHTTPSLCFKRKGKTLYVPLAPNPEQAISSDACTIETATHKYDVGYRGYSYILPQVSVRYQGRTYHVPNECYVSEKVSYDIPAGTYTPSAFYNLIKNYISTPINSPGGTTNKRKAANAFTVTVDGKTCSVPAGRDIMLRNVGASAPFGTVVTIFGGTNLHSDVGVVLDFATYGMYGTANNVGLPSVWSRYNNYSITITTGIKFA